mmetsp:Transcript_3147/g.4826  ORF Transcript_3147/g.4826 Transcript_3147/m.4826 type:complete len:167 (-) Transcript_3147:926-1426(-)
MSVARQLRYLVHLFPLTSRRKALPSFSTREEKGKEHPIAATRNLLLMASHGAVQDTPTLILSVRIRSPHKLTKEFAGALTVSLTIPPPIPSSQNPLLIPSHGTVQDTTFLTLSVRIGSPRKPMTRVVGLAPLPRTLALADLWSGQKKIPGALYIISLSHLHRVVGW